MSGSANTTMTWAALQQAIKLQVLEHQIASCRTLLHNWSLQTGDDELPIRQLSLVNTRNGSDELIRIVADTLNSTASSTASNAQAGSGVLDQTLKESITKMGLTEEYTAKVTRSIALIITWVERSSTQTRKKVRKVPQEISGLTVGEKEEFQLNQEPYQALKSFMPGRTDGWKAEELAEGSIPFALGCALVVHSYPFNETSVRGG